MTAKWTALRTNIEDVLGAPFSQSLRLGLAVSGGVDSMALAHLCSRLQTEEPAKFSFIAFIINHRTKSHSGKDCDRVSHYLDGIGIFSRVIPLEWGLVKDPLSLSNFESKARFLRYRALGQACRDFKIDAMLLGHHADDQAETVLMRLIEKRYGPGLQGMKRKSQIPDCSDMFGVGHPFPTVDHTHTKPCGRVPSVKNVVTSTPAGIPMLRPFLGLRKQELVHACKSASVPWIEDETNEDRTLTLRNTARYMLQGERLPMALQRDSLIALSTAVHSYRNQRRARAQDAFKRLESCSLDPRTGTFVFRIPSSLMMNKEGLPDNQALWSYPEYCMLTEEICHLVSPKSTFQPEAIAHITRKLFMRFSNTGDNEHDLDQSRNAFTAASIDWAPCADNITDLNTWTVSRQAPTRRERQSGETWIFRDTLDSHQRHKLFDGRFWISISMKAYQSELAKVSVRFLEPEDIYKFKCAFVSDEEKRLFSRTISQAAPGRIRWTLPVAVDPLNERPLALPTLGFISAYATPYLLISAHYKVDFV